MLRLHCGMSQADLAEALGLCGKNVINYWETGRTRRMQRAHRLALTRMAFAANFPLEEYHG